MRNSCEPLAAAAARRRGDRDRLEVARPAARADGAPRSPTARRRPRAGRRRSRRSRPRTRGRRAPARPRRRGTSSTARTRAPRPRPPRRAARRPGSCEHLEERRGSRARRAARRRSPRATEWTPDSTRVCATSSAMMNASVETRNQCRESPTIWVDGHPAGERDRGVARRQPAAQRRAAAGQRLRRDHDDAPSGRARRASARPARRGAGRAGATLRLAIRPRRRGSRPRPRSPSRSARRRRRCPSRASPAGRTRSSRRRSRASIAVLIISAISTNAIESSSAISSSA